MLVDIDSTSRERFAAYIAGICCVGTVVVLIDRHVLQPLRSPLKDIPGPPLELSKSDRDATSKQGGDTRLFGHQGRWMGTRTNSYDVHEAWAKEYGKTFIYRGFLQVSEPILETNCSLRLYIFPLTVICFVHV